MKLHIIMHEIFESPAAIEIWATKNNFGVSYTKLYSGDDFPVECDFDFLVIMGGPQSPETTTEECLYFDAKKEVTFIQKAIKNNKIILGVCLGAQLIGEALGARFHHSPHREIGMFPVSLTEDGKQDPIMGKFPENFLVSHWHGDMPGLTPESKILATSEGCPRQIVRYAPKIYGFQCHFEFTLSAIESMIVHNSHELEVYKNMVYVQTPQELRQNLYDGPNKLLFTFLDTIIV